MQVSANIRKQDYQTTQRALIRNIKGSLLLSFLMSFSIAMIGFIVAELVIDEDIPSQANGLYFIGIGVGVLLVISLNQMTLRRVYKGGLYNTGETVYEITDLELIIYGTDVKIHMPYEKMGGLVESESSNTILYRGAGFILPNRDNLVAGDLDTFMEHLKELMQLNSVGDDKG